MGLCRMEKVQLLGHKESREGVVKELQRSGIMQIADLRETLKDSPYEQFLLQGEFKDEDLEKKRLELGSALNYLDSFQKRSLAESLLPAQASLSQKDFLDILRHFDYQEICQTCRKLEGDLKELESEHQRLLREERELSPWRSLNIPLEEIKETRETKVISGTVPGRLFAALKEKLKEASPEVSLEVVEETKTVKYCFLVYHKSHEENISSLLKEFNFTLFSPPPLKGKPGEILTEISQRLSQIEKEREVLRRKGRELLKERVKLAAVYDHLTNLQERKHIENFFAGTEQTFLLSGWLRKRDFPNLEKVLRQKFPQVELARIKPEEGEKPPVDLENSRLVRPFEVVTNLYGLPHHRELDPTPLLAPFFVLFFAISLTDAGYGIVLSLLACLGLKKLNLGEGGRKLFRLLFLGGIMTIVTGLLTGGIFGIDFTEVSPSWEWLKELRARLMLFDPLEDFLVFMLITLGLGFAQIIFGILVKIYENIREGDWEGALGERFPWLLLLPGLLLLGLVKSPEIITLGLVEVSPFQEFWGGIAKGMIFLGAGTIFLVSGRGIKNIFARVGQGFFSLYQAIGYFGDVLSYIRLFALGLATLALAMAINTIAATVADIPFLGPLAFLIVPLILIFGHLSNLLINVLSGFIHSTRLQFVEFFTKFFEGGGKPFKPFREENRYIRVID